MRISLRFLTLLFLVSLFFFFFAGPAFSSEIIRVALEQEAIRLDIDSKKRVQLRFSSGKKISMSVPFHIQPEAGGFRIDGRRFLSKKVRIHNRAKELVLTATKRLTGKGQSKQKWVVGGSVEVRSRGGTLLVVNWIALEDYVAGVVPGEIHPNWPPEALKAQAVAARTYVLYKKMINHDEDYDVVSSVQDQVYRGREQRDSRVDQAVKQTKGKVLTYQNRPIYAAYSSTAAGPTEDAVYVWALDLPYLKGVECPFDESSPRYQWRATFTLEQLERKLRKAGYTVGTIATVTPYTFTPSGRVDRIRMLHSRGSLILRGQDLRRVVGYSTIFSTQFHIERIGREVVLAGRGAGHGVGLCQWGMKEMAELGYGYEPILQYYYPGTELLQLRHVNLTPSSSP